MIIHGQRKSPEYRVWMGMVTRCYNVNDHSWKRYGALGIVMCERWRTAFQNFLDDMGKRPSPKHTIERVNNSRGYFPDNCTWATQKEQANNRRSSRRVTFNGDTLTLAQWSSRTGIKAATIWYRLSKGWTPERTLCTTVSHPAPKEPPQ